VDAKFTAADRAMFSKLRIPKELLAEAGVRRVTHSEAWCMGFRPGTNLRMDGILYPCLDSEGNFINGRIRLDKPAVVRGKVKNKYRTLSAKVAQRALCFLRSQFTEDIEGVGVVESEKAMLALTAESHRAGRKILWVAMGGCWGMWEKKAGVSTPLAEVELLKPHHPRILLDANVTENSGVKMAEDNLALLFGPEVETVHLPTGLEGVNGPDDFLAAQGPAAFWKLWDAPAGCPKAVDPLAIFLHDPLHVAVEKAGRLLATLTEFKLYQRGNGLVHIVEQKETPAEKDVVKRPPGNTYFTLVDADHLEMDLSRSGYVFKKNITTGKIYAADPKRKHAEQVLSQLRSRPEETEWKRIERISNVPLLLADGGLVEKSGYDPTTRVWFDPREFKFPAIPERPSEKHARKAIKLFDRVYGEFPFKDTNSYAVVLSLVLSLLLRHLLPTVPLHLFSAPQPRSGKTKIVEAAAGATTGRDVARINYRNTEEFEKFLPVPLTSGDPLVLIDNVGSAVTSHMLSTVLTTDAEYAVRKLGATEEIRTLNRSVFAATGNQLRIGGDLPGRSIMARINPDCANPEFRSFKFDPPTLARKMFPALAMAALTAARWYIQSDCPEPQYAEGRKELGSFEDWNRIVRGLLVSLEVGDPLATQEEVRETNVDAAADVLLLRTLRADFGDEAFTTADIHKGKVLKDKDKDGKEKISYRTYSSRALLLHGEKGWDATWAGIRIRKLRDYVMDGLKLQKVTTEHAAAVWQVVEVE
jgi:hypothetical protein